MRPIGSAESHADHTGRVTFVLVPGAGGAAWYWSRLVPELEARGASAVAVDLPGEDPSVDLAGYVDRVVDAIESARRMPGPLVLVGQSFGGFSASAAAGRAPVDLLVLLNAMIPTVGESGAAWWRATGQAEARRAAERRAGRDPSRGFDPMEVFFHDAAPDVLAEATEHDREQSSTAFDQPWPGEGWPDVPTAVLVADDDRLFPADWQAAIARERLALEPIAVPGGHLNALTRPAELADALLELVDQRSR